jgi:hypothetical protein
MSQYVSPFGFLVKEAPGVSEEKPGLVCELVMLKHLCR